MKYIIITGLKIALIVTLVLIVLFFPTSIGRKISLHQPIEEVTQIELRYSPWSESKVLCTLEKNEINEFMNSLMKLKRYKNLSPQGEYGSLYVQLTYYDGSIETLGSSALGYTSNHVQEYDGWYYIMEDDLYKLFSEYVELSKLPYF